MNTYSSSSVSTVFYVFQLKNPGYYIPDGTKPYAGTVLFAGHGMSKILRGSGKNGYLIRDV